MCLQERDATIERYKIEKDREIRILQNSWNEEQARLNRELEKLQKRLESVPDEIAKATRGVRQVEFIFSFSHPLLELMWTDPS